jgi:NADH-quinone oxidoreductase subunit J
MNALGPGLFYVSALTALVGALSTVLARSALRSAMGLLLAILGIAGLYVTLSAQLLAAVQLIVYAGAVVVLFVFVIMVLGPSGQAGADGSTLRTRALGAALFALGALGTLVLVHRAGTGGPHVFDRPRLEMGSVWALGSALFGDGMVAFELSGVLLLAAIVGVMAVTRAVRAGPPSEPKPEAGKEAAR